MWLCLAMLMHKASHSSYYHSCSQSFDSSIPVRFQVYSFLGISPPVTGHAMTTLTYRNVNEWIKSSEYRKDFTMPKNTRNMLNKFFEPYNKMLSRLLKDDRYTWKDIELEHDL